jgi:DNA-binding NarL/FixJ family response regulator
LERDPRDKEAQQFMTIDVVAVDNQPLILLALEHLLSNEPDLNLVGTSANGAECLDVVQKHAPDILVLDLHLSEIAGLDVLRRLASEVPAVKIVVLTESVNEKELLEAMRIGFRGVLLKHMAPSFLVQCLRKVAAGGQWSEKDSFGRAFSSLLKRQDGLRQVSEILTSREIQLTRLLAEGLGNRNIAARVHISEGTVKVHLHRISAKLGLQNRVALTLYAKDIRLA